MDQATLRPPGLMDLLSFYGSSKGVKPNTSSLYFTLSDSSYNSVILIARTGHPASHALQKMQSGSFTGSDFFFEVGCPGESTQSKTLTGQTEMQIPSPSQESWTSFGVDQDSLNADTIALTGIVVYCNRSPVHPELPRRLHFTSNLVRMMFTNNLLFHEIRVYR